MCPAEIDGTGAWVCGLGLLALNRGVRSWNS